MLRYNDILHAQKRGKRWDALKLTYKSLNQLSKTHSLKCNCSQCRMITYLKRLENKQQRLQLKTDLKNELND